VIAVDTNILIAAHRVDSPFHEPAISALSSLGGQRWAIPWPCLHEFLAIVTHPRIFAPPTPLDEAIATVTTWLATPLLELLSEGAAHWEELSELLARARVAGPRLHDARIAALCLQHGVDELWTADRDFSRFAHVRTTNPLVARV
jgi:toxin-antitoxin system PIN domain toxin